MIAPCYPDPMSESADTATETAWALHDGAAGNHRQASALAEALGLTARDWPLSLAAPARWFAPRRWPGSEAAFGANFSAALQAPMPTWAIGCGRRAALATRLLHARGARTVQILDPRIDPQHWDLVIAPEHDGLRGSNVLSLIGSLNPVDATWLMNARMRFPELGNLPGPRTTILLGGPTDAVRFDRSAFEVLASKLEYTLATEGGSVIVCGSRRTPREFAEIVRARYGESSAAVWMNNDDGENFYAGALAWADRIIVSPDSVNMMSEACATSAPVFIAEPNRATGRVRRFIASLEASGRVRAQERHLGEFPVTPLAETARIAAQVREFFRAR